MKGKVCIVTGATRGIGEVTARELARDGARVVMVARNQDKANRVREAITAETGSSAIDVIQADLGRQADVRRAASEFLDRYDRLDVLINNAGAINTRRYTTDDGLERTFAVNHLGYFLLTHLLLDVLKKSAPSRVVCVASRAHFRARKIDFDDLQAEERYAGFHTYCHSKLANVMFTYELARRLEGTGVTANCLHPGVIGSGFGHETDGIFRYLVKIGKPFMWTPEKGAVASLRLARDPSLEGVTGKYFDERGNEARSSRASRDEAAQKRLWSVSEELTQIA